MRRSLAAVLLLLFVVVFAQSCSSSPDDVGNASGLSEFLCKLTFTRENVRSADRQLRPGHPVGLQRRQSERDDG
jgi:hypothetical protein